MPGTPPTVFRAQPPAGRAGLIAPITRQCSPRKPVLYASALADNFDDNSQDTAKWNSAGFYEGETTGGTASETNQRLEVTPTPGAIRAAGYVSADSFNLTNDFIAVKISNGAAFSADQAAYLAFGPDNNNYYMFIIWPGGPNNLIARRRINGANTDLLNTTYSATTHAWVRIRHQSSDNTIHFETATSSASDPPSPGDWTDRASETFSSSLLAGNGKAAIGSALFVADASPGAAYFDGFNTATAAAGAGYSLSCTTGAFALTGNAMTPAVAMAADVGAFILTGNAMAPAVTMPAARGSFVLTGNATALGVAMPVTAGSFSLTGAPTGLIHGYKLVLSAGAFTLTGNATGLVAARRMTAATGTFSLSGQATGLAVAMSALTGVFALTPQATALAVTIQMARGTFTLSGIAAGLRVTMSASTGVFVLTGNAAGLNKVGSSTLTAATGSFALTGIAAAALRGARLSAGGGAFTLSGIAATLKSAHQLTASRGAFALTGSAAGILHQAGLSATVAAFNLTGFAAAPTKQSRLQADAGTFVMTGLAARILSIVLPTPESRRVAGVLIDRAIAGSLPSRRTAPNLQPRRSAG